MTVGWVETWERGLRTFIKLGQHNTRLGLEIKIGRKEEECMRGREMMCRRREGVKVGEKRCGRRRMGAEAWKGVVGDVGGEVWVGGLGGEVWEVGEGRCGRRGVGGEV